MASILIESINDEISITKDGCSRPQEIGMLRYALLVAEEYARAEIYNAEMPSVQDTQDDV